MSGRGSRLAPLLVLAAACAREDAGAAEPGPPADPAQEEPLAVEEPAPAALPAGPLEVRVTGDDYHWILRYPGPDGELDSADDVLRRRHLHLPAGREVTLDLESNDLVYTFYVPHLDIMEVAMPGMPFEIELETGPAGTHDLLGSQMCGYTHPELLGDVVIEEAHELEAWLSGHGNSWKRPIQRR